MKKYWIVKPGSGIDSLQIRESESETLKPNEVRIAIKANSINSRDVMAAMGLSPMPLLAEIIPLSDGAGVVTEIGHAVTDFSSGDRVVIAFNPSHQDGPFHSKMSFGALGEVRPGVLANEVVIEETALVRLPDTISFEQAACLPCVAVTAWNALFELSPLMPGQTVVAVGTGTLALTAMQLAKAGGARFGITSSDDAKLDRAQELGADFVVNYRDTPHWSDAVKEQTGGRGADVVLETVGPPSIAQSIKACSQGGRVMQIGFKSMEGPPIEVLDLLVGGVRIVPVMVGSRAVLERVITAVSLHDLKIPIHASFGFEDAPRAFAASMAPESFGKTIIQHQENGAAA